MQEIKRGDGRLWIGDDERNPLAVIEYKPLEKNVFVVTSTRVRPELRGQSIAGILLDQLSDLARKEGFKLKAQCSYVVKKFNLDSKYDDINIEKQS